MSRIGQTTEFVGKTSDMYNKVEGYNQQGASQMGMQKGLVEGAVGFVTDKLWGKPQRRRHLHIYIDGTLNPEFRDRISSVTKQVDSAVEQSVQIAAQHELDEKQAALETLRQQLAESKGEFEKRMNQIREYYNEL